MADLQALIRNLRYRRGALGAQRAERVADTVPEVAKQYNMKALEDLIASGDPITKFDPEKFEEFAAPLTLSQEQRKDYIPALASINQAVAEAHHNPRDPKVGLDSVPELWIYPGGRAIAGRGDPRPTVVAHEGRHRNRVLSKMFPGEKTLVELHPASPWMDTQVPNLDQVFGVRPQGTYEAYEEKLKAILDMYNRLDYIWPEGQPRISWNARGQRSFVPQYYRTPVKFRGEMEPFAGGGAVKKARYAAEEVEELLRRLPRGHKTRSPHMQPIHDEAVQELEKFVLGDSDPLVTVEGGGYKIHVVPLAGDDATEWGPKGRYIVEYGDEMPVPTGRWMDFWDEDLKPYGIKSKRAYDRLDRKERARINAQVQLDKYIGSQFYDSHARFWDPDGYDSFWDKIGQFIPDPQLRNETLRLLSEEPERLPEIEKMFGHIKPPEEEFAGGGKVTDIGRRALFGGRKPKVELEAEPVPQLPAVVEEAAPQLPVAQTQDELASPPVLEEFTSWVKRLPKEEAPPSDELAGLPKLEELVQTPISRRAAMRGAAALATNASRLSKLVPEPKAPEPPPYTVDWEKLRAAGDNFIERLDEEWPGSLKGTLPSLRQMFEDGWDGRGLDAEFVHDPGRSVMSPPEEVNRVRQNIVTTIAKDVFGKAGPEEIDAVEEYLARRIDDNNSWLALQDEGSGKWAYRNYEGVIEHAVDKVARNLVKSDPDKARDVVRRLEKVSKDELHISEIDDAEIIGLLDDVYSRFYQTGLDNTDMGDVGLSNAAKKAGLSDRDYRSWLRSHRQEDEDDVISEAIYHGNIDTARGLLKYLYKHLDIPVEQRQRFAWHAFDQDHIEAPLPVREKGWDEEVDEFDE